VGWPDALIGDILVQSARKSVVTAERGEEGRLDCIQDIEIQTKTGNPDRDARVTLNKHQLNVRVRQNHRTKDGRKKGVKTMD